MMLMPLLTMLFSSYALGFQIPGEDTRRVGRLLLAGPEDSSKIIRLEVENKLLKEQLAQKDKEYRKQLTQKDEEHRKQLAQKDEEHRKQLAQKDEQLEKKNAKITEVTVQTSILRKYMSILRGRRAIEEFEYEFSEDALIAEAKALEEEERKARQLNRKTGKKKSTRRQKQDENQEQQKEYYVSKYEKIRRSQERTWLRIFKYLSHVPRVAKLKNIILKRTTPPNTVEEFAREISMAHGELSKIIHSFFFDWVTGRTFTKNLALTKESSTAVEIVMSMFNFEAPE